MCSTPSTCCCLAACFASRKPGTRRVRESPAPRAALRRPLSHSSAELAPASGRVAGACRAKGRAVAPAVLAEHFRDGDERSKAFAYTMEAAEAALDAYAFTNAVFQLEGAQQLLPSDADAAMKYRLWDMLATAYGSSGRLDDAIGASHTPLSTPATILIEPPLNSASVRRFNGKATTTNPTAITDLPCRRSDILALMAMGLLFGLWRAFVYVHMIPSWLALGRSRPDLTDGSRSRPRLTTEWLGAAFKASSVIATFYTGLRPWRNSRVARIHRRGLFENFL